MWCFKKSMRSWICSGWPQVSRLQQSSYCGLFRNWVCTSLSLRLKRLVLEYFLSALHHTAFSPNLFSPLSTLFLGRLPVIREGSSLLTLNPWPQWPWTLPNTVPKGQPEQKSSPFPGGGTSCQQPALVDRRLQGLVREQAALEKTQWKPKREPAPEVTSPLVPCGPEKLSLSWEFVPQAIPYYGASN